MTRTWCGLCGNDEHACACVGLRVEHTAARVWCGWCGEDDGGGRCECDEPAVPMTLYPDSGYIAAVVV